MSTSRKRLPRLVWAANPAVTAAIDRLVSAIEQASAWAWGPGFDVKHLEGATVVQYQPPSTIFPAVATSTITARSGDTAGSGTFKLRTVSVTTLADGATGLTVLSNFGTAVASGKALMVGRDAAGIYWLLSGDCP